MLRIFYEMLNRIVSLRAFASLLVGVLLLGHFSIARAQSDVSFERDTLVLKALSTIQVKPTDIGLSPETEPPDRFRFPLITELLQSSWNLETVSRTVSDSLFEKFTQPVQPISKSWPALIKSALHIRDTIWSPFTSSERASIAARLPDLYREDDDVADLDLFTLQARREAGADSFRSFVTLVKRLPAKTAWQPLLDSLREFANTLTPTSDWESIFGSLRHTPLTGVTGSIIGWQETGFGKLVIGGAERNIYSGEFSAIIDIGGNDDYSGRFAGATPSIPIGLVIDFAGSDLYRADSSFSAGAAFDGVAFLLDCAGDDHYIGSQWSQAAAMMGAARLEDRSGFDSYEADANSQACAGWGSAALVDISGNDVYRIHMYGQGIGLVAGTGALIDSSGDDQYLATPRYTDVLRYQDHSLTLSQGFGYGLRPYLSGGIGMLRDESGSDFYLSDIYGQGASYWYSLGILHDRTGNDRYQSYQYAQGSGIHISLGILLDDAGNDHYDSKGVSQGCGHDLGTGWLRDRKGDDSYLCSELSQAAGSANGFGIFMDDDGEDVYGNRNDKMTLGYGNPRRDYGSIGIFIDRTGHDRYADPTASDHRIWLRGIRGVGLDAASSPPMQEKK